jgi:hypothetical protein
MAFKADDRHDDHQLDEVNPPTKRPLSPRIVLLRAAMTDDEERNVRFGAREAAGDRPTPSAEDSPGAGGAPGGRGVTFILSEVCPSRGVFAMRRIGLRAHPERGPRTLNARGPGGHTVVSEAS